jgi:hypothetical protein
MHYLAIDDPLLTPPVDYRLIKEKNIYSLTAQIAIIYFHKR